jgi:hypothetical protein
MDHGTKQIIRDIVTPMLGDYRKEVARVKEQLEGLQREIAVLKNHLKAAAQEECPRDE